MWAEDSSVSVSDPSSPKDRSWDSFRIALKNKTLAHIFAPVSVAFQSFIITVTGVALLISDNERIKRREASEGAPFSDLSQVYANASCYPPNASRSSQALVSYRASIHAVVRDRGTRRKPERYFVPVTQ